MTNGPTPLFPLPNQDPARGSATEHSSYPQLDTGDTAKATAQGPRTGGNGPQPKHWAMIAACVAAVIAVVGVAVMAFGGNDEAKDRSSNSGTTAPALDEVTPCSSPPTARAESVDYGPDGLTITTSLSSACSNGDLLTNSSFRVTAFDGPGRDVAAGVFDLSSNPIAVPGDGESSTVQLTFPAGTYWRTAESTIGGLTLTTHLDGTDSNPQSGTSSSSASAFDVGTPEHGPLDAAASSALVDITAADRSYIDANLLEVWQPQLSSKRPGLYYDGLTWQANDIVREHMQNRQRYPNAKLLWSGEWPVYSIKDWWITVSGITFGDGPAANQWCTSQGYDADHCFAKLLSHSRGPEGTTINR